MPLSGKRAVFLAAAAAALVLGCHDSTTSPVFTDYYFLESVDGEPIPVVVAATTSDTTTVVWASIALDGVKNALASTRIRLVHLTSAPVELTYPQPYFYRVIGDSVAFDDVTPCRDTGTCAGPPVGKFVNGTLLIRSPNTQTPVYLYRRAILATN